MFVSPWTHYHNEFWYIDSGVCSTDHVAQNVSAALNNEAYVPGKSIFKNINIGCLGSYFVVWHLKTKRIAIIISFRHNASKIAELPQRFLKQGRHLQVGEVSFRSFFFLFFFVFLRIHVIDLYEFMEIRQKSCPTKSLLHMTYMLVYLRTKRRQLKELIARGTKDS